ncbi:protein YfdO [Lelliottia amnigena]|nr:protein YfdO [Lelliottia amnigena]
MRVQDNRTHYEICDLFQWANRDEFWKDNILSPSSLRKQWDQLTTKRLRATGTASATRATVDLHNTDWIDGVLE